MCPGQTLLQLCKEMCTRLFTAIVFVMADICKEPKCPSVEAWIRKMLRIYVMDYNASVRNRGSSFFNVMLHSDAFYQYGQAQTQPWMKKAKGRNYSCEFLTLHTK